MIKFRNGLYTSVWNPTKQRRDGGVGGYDDTPTDGQHRGVAELGSADLRTGIAISLPRASTSRPFSRTTTTTSTSRATSRG
jgi:hypothetical protein